MNTINAPRDLPLGYLRTFLTLLVVAHHALLAYHPYAPPPAGSLLTEPRLWMAFPIVDAARWNGVDSFIGFNDVFFMSLLFLVSGVFAWVSLTRRGAGGFLRERVVRLGVPFAIGAGVLAPLAYYPTWLQMGRPGGAFWSEWLALGEWPAGPAWFLWVLLAFGALAALLYRIAPAFGARLGVIAGRLGQRPLLFFLALLAISAIAYVPLALAVDPSHWSSWGPFYVQTSRVLHYAVYFFVGIGLGAAGLGRGLFDRAGRLARRWPLWLIATLFAFALAFLALILILQSYATGGPSIGLTVFGNGAWVLLCACASLLFIALFARFTRGGNPVMNALSSNAYGIYLVHYACVSWLQWSLLGTALPGWAKGCVVVLAAVILSRGASAAVRRIPGVARVL
jgi:peptidoglycan/LPS O-acetylase OafA/YrhL